MWLAEVFLAALLLGACGSDVVPTASEATSPVTTAPLTTATASTTSVVSASSVPVEGNWIRPFAEEEYSSIQPVLDADGIRESLTFSSCAWVEPGRFRFSFDWAPLDENTVTILPLELLLYQGDMGTGGGGEATLVRAGSVDGIVDLNVNLRSYREETQEWAVWRGMLEGERSQTCAAEVIEGVEIGDWQDLQADPRAPTLLPADPTLDDIIRAMPFDGSDPLLPLAFIRAQGGLDRIDEVAVADGADLQWVNLAVEGTCVTLTSEYGPELDRPATTVTQTRGCAEPADITSPGGTWQLEIEGTAPDRINWYAVEGVEALPADENGFDPDEWLDAYFADHPDDAELARFDWDGSRLAIVGHDPSAAHVVERYSDPVVSPPSTFRGGGSGRGCNDYSFHTSQDQDRGFLFVVAERPDLRFEITGGREPELIDIDGDHRQVGFLDLGPDSPSGIELISVTDADGNVVPCIQG